jgi:hypothetical protein
MASSIQKMEIMDDAMADILRQKTPAERLAIANGMWRFARDMLRAVIARENPGWTEDEVNRMVARRLSHGAI